MVSIKRCFRGNGSAGLAGGLEILEVSSNLFLEFYDSIIDPNIFTRETI